MANVSVILPVRNEEENIKKTLTALQNQTIKPKEVVIVDDASTDNTFEVIQEIAKKNNWTIYRRERNDERYSSIVNSMIIATTLLKNDFDYLMTLDGDTILEVQYVEKILKKFEEVPMLGIAGGYLKSSDDRNMISFLKYSFNVFGSNRIYSKKCWLEINGGKKMKASSVTWDTEHSVLAESKDYTVKRYDKIFSESIRPTSNKIPSFMRGSIFYQFGYGLPFTIVHSLLKLKFNCLAGYVYAWIKNKNRIGDEELLKKIKKQNNSRSFKTIRKVLFKT